MKNILLSLTFITFLFSCNKFAPEYEPFHGYKDEQLKSENISLRGSWRLESGYRIEKYQGIKDSIIVQFKAGVPNTIYTSKTDERMDNINVNYTTWLFIDSYFFYDSLDRYNFVIQLNKTIDITIPVSNTKRLYYIQSLNETQMVVKSGSQYIGVAGENSNYSILKFKKI